MSEHLGLHAQQRQLRAVQRFEWGQGQKAAHAEVLRLRGEVDLHVVVLVLPAHRQLCKRAQAVVQGNRKVCYTGRTWYRNGVRLVGKPNPSWQLRIVS